MPEALGWGQEGENRGWDELLGIILLTRGAWLFCGNSS